MRNDVGAGEDREGTDWPWHPLCQATDLVDAGEAVPFDVRYRGQACRAFAIRYQGQVRAYLNRCSHVAMEMDWMPNRFFDLTGHFLVCGAHGALYEPHTGRCVGGPCRGPLVAIGVCERDGVVFWQSKYDLQPLVF
ncbi:MAG: Rieske (2Fe-2S) protein [Tepidimonas sp.]|uniref:Rieske (2Fe-2S) protein n=1 Tax=Tepidimonas sp. TaxID=2002775 RepID=UPI004054C814